MKKFFILLLMLCGVTAAVAQPSSGGGYTANSYEMLRTCVENAIRNGNPTATIKLTADIYLSDGDGSTICSTFTGTLDTFEEPHHQVCTSPCTYPRQKT